MIELRKCHSNALVENDTLRPILVDGKTELSQATAILSYISHKAKRTPTDPAEAARLLMLSLGAEDLRIKYFGYFSSNPEKKKEHETDLCRRWFGNYEKNLKKVQDGKAFFGGDLISYADCAIWEVIDAHVQWIKPTEKILKEFPLLSAWFDRFKKSPRIAPYLASDRHFKG